jgi:phosphoglycolate phosphatase-like HAD superfamily hydrolase
MIDSAIQVLVFDFDGVIVESNAVKTEVFSDIFKGYPGFYEVMMDYHLKNISSSRVDKFRYLAGLLKLEDPALFMDEILKKFSHTVKKRVISAPLVDGAQSLLAKYFKEMPIYLASVTPEEELKDILVQKNIECYFKGVYGCPPWKKSDALSDIANLENVDVSSMLLIGDSSGDQRAAKIAGVNFVGRDSGLGFENPRPTVFKSMHEIDFFIENYGV